MKKLRYLQAITFLISTLAIGSAHAGQKCTVTATIGGQTFSYNPPGGNKSKAACLQLANQNMGMATNSALAQQKQSNKTNVAPGTSYSGKVVVNYGKNTLKSTPVKKTITKVTAYDNSLGEYSSISECKNKSSNSSSCSAVLNGPVAVAKPTATKPTVAQQINDQRKLVLGAELPKTSVAQQINNMKKVDSRILRPVTTMPVPAKPTPPVVAKPKTPKTTAPTITKPGERTLTLGGSMSSAIGSAMSAYRAPASAAAPTRTLTLGGAPAPKPAVTTPKPANPYSDQKVQAYLKAVQAARANAQSERTLTLGGR